MITTTTTTGSTIIIVIIIITHDNITSSTSTIIIRSIVIISVTPSSIVRLCSTVDIGRILVVVRIIPLITLDVRIVRGHVIQRSECMGHLQGMDFETFRPGFHSVLYIYIYTHTYICVYSYRNVPLVVKKETRNVACCSHLTPYSFYVCTTSDKTTIVPVLNRTTATDAISLSAAIALLYILTISCRNTLQYISTDTHIDYPQVTTSTNTPSHHHHHRHHHQICRINAFPKWKFCRTKRTTAFNLCYLTPIRAWRMPYGGL